MTTPNTPEPAKWAVEAAVEALPMEGGEDSQRRSRILNERAELAAIIQRHADSAMEALPQLSITDLPAQLLDVHAICDQRDAAVAERDQIRAQLAAAEEKVKELEKDKERLDWLDAHPESGVNTLEHHPLEKRGHCYTNKRWVTKEGKPGNYAEWDHYYGPTARSAIDAARTTKETK